MDNLTHIANPDPKVVTAALSRDGVERVHATNGVLAGPPERLLPTNLACFKLIDDRKPDHGVFLIAVNSDESVEKLNADKAAKGENIPPSVPQEQRAGMIGKAVAALFPTRSVYTVLYDDKTPEALYETLQDSGIEMETLFKGNYGTSPDQGRIEGAHCFAHVIAFPLPHVTAALQPYASGITEKGDLPEHGEVLRLTQEKGAHGRPYMSEANKLLFPVPQGLASLWDNSLNRSGPSIQP
jgi:hypothetical protein